MYKFAENLLKLKLRFSKECIYWGISLQKSASERLLGASPPQVCKINDSMNVSVLHIKDFR